jgi:hypothetical protein
MATPSLHCWMCFLLALLTAPNNTCELPLLRKYVTWYQGWCGVHGIREPVLILIILSQSRRNSAHIIFKPSKYDLFRGLPKLSF